MGKDRSHSCSPPAGHPHHAVAGPTSQCCQAALSLTETGWAHHFLVRAPEAYPSTANRHFFLMWSHVRRSRTVSCKGASLSVLTSPVFHPLSLCAYGLTPHLRPAPPSTPPLPPPAPVWIGRLATVVFLPSSSAFPGTWFSILAFKYSGRAMSTIANVFILLFHPSESDFFPSPHACGFHFHYKSNLFALSFLSPWRCCTSIILVTLAPGRDSVCEKLSA